jgi:hypothetical protein
MIGDILNKREHGQITILMVFAIVALFGAAALAIDGGLLYFQRRAAQSTADDVAMTGALAIIEGYSGSQIETMSLERARQNGFDNSLDDVDLQVHWPPEAPNPYAGDPSFIQPCAVTYRNLAGCINPCRQSIHMHGT